ncbi:type IV pilus assembly protein PilN [Caldanaerobius fijiensis DSM 17918]|uniref:Type IV pilus assembly protein PilN n=1 Tax=Caldanaerobius fijiensis DSM 17918 TaxID=1121256 RepID=A0A1M4U411_9THEO|nr:type IV pilus assembly protein PilN [Caldanaerobius fijiensis DSM 17918]
MNIKDINLLPEEIYIKEYQRKKRILKTLLILLFFAFLIGIYVETVRVQSTYESKIDSITIKAKNGTISDLSRLKDLENAVVSMKKSVEQIKKTRMDWPAIFDDITLITPRNVSIINLTADEQGMKLTGEAKSAEDIALFIKNLKSLNYIYEIKPVSIGDENKGILSFNLNIYFKVAQR